MSLAEREYMRPGWGKKRTRINRLFLKIKKWSISTVSESRVLILFLLVIFAYSYYEDMTHEIKINTIEMDSDWIDTVISRTDTNLTKKIDSINIVSIQTIQNVCHDYKAVGCADMKTTENGGLIKADIYISDKISLSGTCNTQAETLYHEIGHVYNVYYKIKDTEANAERYASKFSKFTCYEGKNTLRNKSV